MLNRRSLLVGTGTLALSQLLMGCNAQSTAALRVQLLKDSLPPQLIKEFQRRVDQGSAIALGRSDQFPDLLTLLEAWMPNQPPPQPSGFALPFEIPFLRRPPEPIADLVSLGDFWLASAIQRQLIQPFSTDKTIAGAALPSVWQTLVRRDRQGFPAATGEIWAVPYRWGSLMIAYNKDKLRQLGWTPQSGAKLSWTDLWRPEFKGAIALPNSPRAVIGLTLKKLNQSANLANLAQVPSLAAELQTLDQQVKLYSSEAYLQPLILDDVAIAVGWSMEILPTVRRNPNIAAVLPATGSLLTADLWVRPAHAPRLEANSLRAQLLQNWLEFYWKPEVAAQLALLSFAAAPVFVNSGQNGGQTDSIALPPSLQKAPLIQPAAELFQRSEFLLPLNASAIADYRRQWLALRQTSPLSSR